MRDEKNKKSPVEEAREGSYLPVKIALEKARKQQQQEEEEKKRKELSEQRKE